MFSGKRYLWVVVAALLCHYVQGQSYNYTHYTIEDGLPSNEVFSIVQDQTGYLWASTDKGIVRFDGSGFKHYGIPEGLKSSVSYKLLASPLDGIAFYDAENRVGFIRNDSIRYFLDHAPVSIGTIASSTEGLVVCYRGETCFELYDWKGQLLQRQCYSPGFRIVDHKKLGPMRIGNHHPDDKDHPYVGPNGKITKGSELLQSFWNTSSVVRHNEQTLLIGGSEICQLENGTKKALANLNGKATSGYYVDEKDKIWIGLEKGGVDVLDLNEHLKHTFCLLNGKTVTSICADTDGNLWFTTLSHGIYKLTRSPYQTLIRGNIRHIARHNDHIVASKADSSLVFYHTQSRDIREEPVGFRVSDFHVLDNRLLISTNPEPKGLPPFEGIEYLYLSFSKLTQYKGMPFSMAKNRVYIKREKGLDQQMLPNIGMGYTYSAKTYGDTVYVGRSEGLFKVYEENGVFTADRILPIPVTDMLPTSQGYALGTKGHGLMLTDRSFAIDKVYSVQNGLSGNFISSMVCYQNMLICGTNNGISTVPIFETWEEPVIHTSYTSDGLLSSSITDLILFDQHLIAATEKGVQKIFIEDLFSNSNNPVPVLHHLNQQPVSGNENRKIAAGTKVIKVGLGTIFFQEHSNYIREYRLIGSDSNWTTSNSSELEFLNLNPGHYELQFRTKLHRNTNYSVASLHFELLPLFTETIWFKLSIALVIVLFLLSARFLREKRIREKNSMTLLQEQLRYKALASQLNPHFLFNALGSVQHLILTKKNDKAAEYLASFSGLLSKTLKNTDKLFVPLRDEMAFVDEYVTIEQFRFEKNITFSWHISEGIEPRDVLVPTMFLQPYVENAIIHGINPSSHPGQIDVYMNILKPGTLEIRIVDNGIGIDVAKQNKSKRARKSMAMENIQIRIQTMAKLYKNSFRHKATQLVTKEGRIEGTEVIIDIPYKTN